MEWLFGMGLTGWLLTAVVILLLVTLWKWHRSTKQFAKMGIPSPPSYPIVGASIPFFKYGTIGTLERHQKQYGKIYGMNATTGPTMAIGDMDMVREILVKQFHCFPNRSASRMNHKPWKDGLMQITGDHWKHVRSTLSPTFSSGKIKRMMPAIQQVSVVLKDYLSEKAAQGEMIELKDICSRFAMDVIGGVAFGMDVSSIQNPEHHFVKNARRIMNPSKLQLFIAIVFPNLLARLANWGLMSDLKKAQDFFMSIAEQALNSRQTDRQKHQDFLQLLVEAEIEGEGEVDSEINHENHLVTSEKWTRKGLTKDEMVANALLFFLAGYETVSTTVALTLFCLAHNPECLHRAQEEVDSKLGKNMVNYETANTLTYLEMCINETMRLYPVGFVLVRSAVQEVEVRGVKFPKGMGVFIPVCLIHKDPEVWPDPETFDPLRFTTEEKAKRHPMSFLPFGMGPRNCIGMRLAQLELRMAVATVLQHFTPTPCSKTVYPPRLKKFQMIAMDGLWLNLPKRE